MKYTGLVLIVDDEEPVREAVMDILEYEGINVLTAANGKDGVALYQQHLGKIDLVLMDMSMPGMSGTEAYQELLKIDPQVKVVLSSGYTETEISRRYFNHDTVGFLQKPYDLMGLITVVRHYLQK